MAGIRNSRNVYTGVDIELEGNEYYECKFTNCRIIYRGGPAVLSGCEFHDSPFVFAGAAADTINFMKALYQNGGGGEKLVRDTCANIMRDQ